MCWSPAPTALTIQPNPNQPPLPQGIASRDIKLENVLLDDSPHPIAKLADFGLSARCDARGHVRHCGALGTPMYFAPELLGEYSEGDTYDAKVGGVRSGHAWAARPALLARARCRRAVSNKS